MVLGAQVTLQVKDSIAIWLLVSLCLEMRTPLEADNVWKKKINVNICTVQWQRQEKSFLPCTLPTFSITWVSLLKSLPKCIFWIIPCLVLWPLLKCQINVLYIMRYMNSFTVLYVMAEAITQNIYVDLLY